MSASSAEIMKWMDGFWDPAAALLWNPPGAMHGVAGRSRHLVRESAWYALGLLTRGDGDDLERAHRTLHSVLEHQYHAPGGAWHGTFRRYPQEPAPLDDARMWRDYDPNWRQFVGCTLLMALRLDPERIQSALRVRMTRAVRECVLGEPLERINAQYTNIALLRSWLETEAGVLLADADFVRRGKTLANDVAERVARFGTFDEFNSPTYYGVNLLGAGLMARHSQHLADIGRHIEAVLWREITSFYHPLLQNLCGPWMRSYGMDLHQYVGLVSLWLNTALGTAPLPPLADSVEHGHDLCLAPLVALTRTELPPDCVAPLRDWLGPRQIARRLPGGALATAVMSRDAMWGGVHGVVQPANGQFHPGTAHWRRSDGSLGWLRVHSAAPLNITAAPRGLQIVSTQPAQPITLHFDRDPALAESGPLQLLADIHGMQTGLARRLTLEVERPWLLAARRD